MRSSRHLFWLCMVSLFSGAILPVIARAQINRGPCLFWQADRSPELAQPWMHPELPCLEQAVGEDLRAGALAFLDIAAAPDGTLYAVRPLSGEVMAIRDEDGEGIPDTLHRAISGFRLPQYLTFADGALYISDVRGLWRWQPGNGRAERLIANEDERNPAPGAVVVTGNRLLVTYPASGEVRAFATDELDEDAGTVCVRGLMRPTALAAWGGAIIVVDMEANALYRLPTACDGQTSYCPALAGLTDCEMLSPLVTFPPGSFPIRAAVFSGDVIPLVSDSLLVVLNGSHATADLEGYALVAVSPEGDVTTLMPAPPETDNPAFDDFTTRRINQYGAGFFPHRPLSVAVSSTGTIFVLVENGQILSIRNPFDLY